MTDEQIDAFLDQLAENHARYEKEALGALRDGFKKSFGDKYVDQEWIEPFLQDEAERLSALNAEYIEVLRKRLQTQFQKAEQSR